MATFRVMVCKDCWSSLPQTYRTTQWRSAARQWTQRSTYTSASMVQNDVARNKATVLNPRLWRQSSEFAWHLTTQHAKRALTQTAQDFGAIHTRIQDLAATVLKPEDRQLPAEQRVLYVFEQIDALLSQVLSNETPHNSSESSTRAALRTKSEPTATTALLGSVKAVKKPSALTKEVLMTEASEHAEAVMRNPNVFITPAILKSYVELQTKLEHPNSFPDILHSYASKPVPSLKGKDTAAGIVFTDASPNKVNAAVDSNVASMALTAAIDTNSLPLAIDIIHASFCAPAFKRSKILRQALIPMSGLAVAPIAAYTLSASFSNWQNTMSPDYATGLAFAGIMTYVAAVGTMGYITVTTANDQMNRVTWAQGVPLWERWIREEERAAIDRVASAWGFQDTGKRGDEDGEEWQGLKDFVGLNGMVLDRVELMDGME